MYLDTKVPLDFIPKWDGDDKRAMTYFNDLNELVRESGPESNLAWQLPRLAPMGFRGLLRIWWSNLSDGLKDQFRLDLFSFIRGLRLHYLTDRWGNDRRAEFQAMRFREVGHLRETPFEYMNRRIFLARILYDLTPEEMVAHVLTGAPGAWLFLLGEHVVRDTDDLLHRVREAGPSLTAAYQAGTGSDGDTLDDKVNAIVEKRLGPLLSSAVQRAP
ncbi:hypothetical protein EXIGLDRAFT_782170, partial [Exidia glandulosa HHB12029]